MRTLLLLLVLSAVVPAGLYGQVERYMQAAGYGLAVKPEPPPLSLPVPHRYYDLDNGDDFAVYVFPDAAAAEAAKAELLGEASPDWDFLIPLYYTKGRLLLVYFTNPAKAKPPLFAKLEKLFGGMPVGE